MGQPVWLVDVYSSKHGHQRHACNFDTGRLGCHEALRILHLQPLFCVFCPCEHRCKMASLLQAAYDAADSGSGSGSSAVDYSAVMAHLMSLGPSAVDVEVRTQTQLATTKPVFLFAAKELSNVSLLLQM